MPYKKKLSSFTLYYEYGGIRVGFIYFDQLNVMGHTAYGLIFTFSKQAFNESLDFHNRS